MVKRIITYYCEACQTAYETYEEALRCEQSAQSKLSTGDVILRGARGGYGFELEHGGLIWAVVKQVREEVGQPGAPGHRFVYQTTGVRREIAEEDLLIPKDGGLAIERGLSEGPGHTRQLTYLMETFEEVRQQMAECFALLSRCAGVEELTPEAYAKWDDLRYTAYDFGAIDGDLPATLPPAVSAVLRWCAVPKPPADVHASLFNKPELGLHGGKLIFAPFDDNIGMRTKWLIGRGDAYRYLRFHMQSRAEQLAEISGLQERICSGDPVWFDRLEYLFTCSPDVTPPPPELFELYPDLDDFTLVEELLKPLVFDRLVHNQERWRTNVSVETTIIPNRIPVLAVAAGKGGVGKSTVAANLARSAARQGLKPLFLDLDFYGPSAPTEFNLHESLQIERGFIVPHQADGVRVVSIGNMIGEDTALHWRGPVLEAFIHLLTAHIDYTDVDVILLDCPPGTGDVQLGMMNRIKPQLTVLVTTASELALADVRRAAQSFRGNGSDVFGVIENMSAIKLTDGTEKRLFGTPNRVHDFCADAHLRYLGQVPFVDTREQLAEALDQVAGPLLERLRIQTPR